MAHPAVTRACILPRRRPVRQWARACAAALATCFSLGSGVSHSASVPWPEAAFTYYTDSKPLHVVLAEFASGFSLSLDIPPGFESAVSGRFNQRTPTEFIDRLAGIYGFNWFAHAGTLFISSNKDVTVRAELAP